MSTILTVDCKMLQASKPIQQNWPHMEKVSCNMRASVLSQK